MKLAWIPFFSLKMGDGVLLLCSLLGIVWFSYLRYTHFAEDALYLFIQNQHQQYYYPLAEEGRYTFKNSHGEIVLMVKEGGAFVESADCPLQICRSKGMIRYLYAFIACLPNQIFVSIVSLQSAHTTYDSLVF